MKQLFAILSLFFCLFGFIKAQENFKLNETTVLEDFGIDFKNDGLRSLDVVNESFVLTVNQRTKGRYLLIFIDKDGKLIKSIENDYKIFLNGESIVGMSKKVDNSRKTLYGILDDKFEFAVQPTYLDAIDATNEKFYALKDGQGYFLMKKKNKAVAFRFPQWMTIDSYQNGELSYHGKHPETGKLTAGYIDEKGNDILKDLPYGKYLAFNTKGYAEFLHPKSGKYISKDKFGVINRAGEVISNKFNNNKIFYTEDGAIFHYSTSISKGGGVANEQGKTYEKLLSNFVQITDSTFLTTQKVDAPGFMDKNGSWLHEPKTFANDEPISSVAQIESRGLFVYEDECECFKKRTRRDIYYFKYNQMFYNRTKMDQYKGEQDALRMSDKKLKFYKGNEGFKLGILSPDGKDKLTKAVYDAIYIEEGTPAVVRKGSRFGWVDFNGKETLLEEGLIVYGFFRHGAIPVKRTQRIGIFNSNSFSVDSWKSKDISTAYSFNNGFARIYREGDSYWNKHQSDFKFNSSYGFMSENLDLIVPMNFLKASDMIDGKALVMTPDMKWHVLTLENKAE